jgi:hypothetical protein
MDNLIKDPKNSKFQTIRYENKIFKDKVANVRGAEKFLGIAGFIKDDESEAYIFAGDAALSAERFSVRTQLNSCCSLCISVLCRALKL